MERGIRQQHYVVLLPGQVTAPSVGRSANSQTKTIPRIIWNVLLAAQFEDFGASLKELCSRAPCNIPLSPLVIFL